MELSMHDCMTQSTAAALMQIGGLGRPPQVCFRFFMLLERQFLCHEFLYFDSI
jgi:hypothetical protein